MIPLEGVLIEGEQIVIYLGIEGANWLASELPPTDLFTRELLTAIEKIEARHSDRSSATEGGHTT